MGSFWDRENECMTRDRLHDLQSKRLVALVKRVYTNVPYYRNKMHEKGLVPEDIKSVEDLEKLPFTTKQDLRETYPFGLFASPLDEIVRVHASSGTTGKQTVVGYTQNDISLWSELMARCFAMTGADKTSRIQVSYGYGLFTGGLGAHYGAERIGAVTIPTSSGNTQRQITIMQDFGTTVLCCTPSYALYLAETMEEMGIKPDDIKLKAGVFGAEPWTESMRVEIEERLKIKAHDIYGLSEIMGPGVSMDCVCQKGLHVWEDHFIPEIINPNTGETLPAKTNGELVFTTLTKEGFPLIRYRTRDVSSLDYDVCECGRTMARMAKPSGRTDDMLIIRGVNVFPSQIESVLLEMGETSPHYMIIVDRVGTLDTIEIQVELTPDMVSDEVKKIEDLENRIKKNIESILGLSAKITLVESKTIQRSEGKAKRVIDKRKK
ncbi:MAG: Phenylacetate-coenzyme A ligase [Firmicutes bacterium ADurb.Bin193]|nr:MAG: Phenylacetate-coenzyme A ligase [Firmicutes bacterium ADurb.Bin193]